MDLEHVKGPLALNVMAIPCNELKDAMLYVDVNRIMPFLMCYDCS